MLQVISHGPQVNMLDSDYIHQIFEHPCFLLDSQQVVDEGRLLHPEIMSDLHVQVIRQRDDQLRLVPANQQTLNFRQDFVG